jgi:hypothetical protein
MAQEISHLDAIASNSQPTKDADVTIQLDLNELTDDPDLVIDVLLDHHPVGASVVHSTSGAEYDILVVHDRKSNKIYIRWANAEEILRDNEDWTYEEALELVHPSKRR